MAEFLTNDLKYPKQNVMKLNAARGPTKDAVLKALKDVVSKLREEDLLLFYYSGHGKVVNSGQEFGFCTKGPCLLKAELLDAIKEVTSKVVIIIDACHSGQFNTAKSRETKSKAADEFDTADLEEWFRTNGRVVITAAAAQQEAPGSSAFTHAFIEATKNIMASKDKRLCVKVGTLFDELSEILEKNHKADEDRPPPARMTGVDSLGSFGIGPF